MLHFHVEVNIGDQGRNHDSNVQSHDDIGKHCPPYLTLSHVKLHEKNHGEWEHPTKEPQSFDDPLHLSSVEIYGIFDVQVNVEQSVAYEVQHNEFVG